MPPLKRPPCKQSAQAPGTVCRSTVVQQLPARTELNRTAQNHPAPYVILRMVRRSTSSF